MICLNTSNALGPIRARIFRKVQINQEHLLGIGRRYTYKRGIIWTLTEPTEQRKISSIGQQ